MFSQGGPKKSGLIRPDDHLGGEFHRRPNSRMLSHRQFPVPSCQFPVKSKTTGNWQLATGNWQLATGT
jgi:hypothetical protein